LSSLLRAGYLTRSDMEALIASRAWDILAHQFDEQAAG